MRVLIADDEKDVGKVLAEMVPSVVPISS